MKKYILFKDIRDKINIYNNFNGFIKIIFNEECYYVKDIKLSPIELRDKKVLSISVIKVNKKDIAALKNKFINFKLATYLLEIKLKEEK